MTSDECSNGTDCVAVDCDSCNWQLTVSDLIERIENNNTLYKPTADRIRSKMGSLGEGHAYFNRGHSVSILLSKDQIEQYLQPDTK